MPAMNKSMLARRRRELEAYAQVLPSLELKRWRLAALLASERHELAATGARLDAAIQAMAQRLPMLAGECHRFRERVPALRLATLEQAEVRQLGVALPALPPEGEAGWTQPDSDLLATPAWLDMAWQGLHELAALDRQVHLRRARIGRLEVAVKLTLQRVNLFEKVLIPQARSDIHAIRILLADAERAAVVRAKRARALLHRDSESREVAL